MSAELAVLNQVKAKQDMYVVSEEDFNPHTMLDISGMFPKADLVTGGNKKIVLDIVEPTEYISCVDVVDPFDDDSGVTLYKFDGNVLDESGNYPGTNTDVDLSQIGKFGKCGTYNGTTSHIDILSTANKNIRCVSIWVKSTDSSNTDDQTIFNSIADDSSYYTDGILINITGSSSKITAIFRDGTNGISVTQTGILNDSMYTHIVAFIESDNRTIRLYVNNVLSNSGVLSNDFQIGTHNVILGQRSLTYYFNGGMDQARFFNRALTESEVQILYQEKVER